MECKQMGPKSVCQNIVLGLKTEMQFFCSFWNTVNQYLPADFDENINLILFTITSVSRSTNEFSYRQRSSGPLWSRQHETGSPSLSSPIFPFSLLSFMSLIAHYPLQVSNQKSRNPADRYSLSLDDVRLYSPLLPLGKASVPNTSVSYTFGLPNSPTSLCPDSTSFCVQRSTNCPSLDLLDDNQPLELVL